MFIKWQYNDNSYMSNEVKALILMPMIVFLSGFAIYIVGWRETNLGTSVYSQKLLIKIIQFMVIFVSYLILLGSLYLFT